MNTMHATELFESWFDGLKDRLGKARIAARIRRAELGHFGDCAPVGEGVSEMRVHIGPGYRVYFKQVGSQVYWLLAGGDKSSQSRDIQTALQMARQLGDE